MSASFKTSVTVQGTILAIHVHCIFHTIDNCIDEIESRGMLKNPWRKYMMQEIKISVFDQGHQILN